MMSLFDEEQIMEMHIKSERREAAEEAAEKAARETAREAAERLLKIGKLTLDEIALCIPSLSIEELKELEAEITQSV